MASQKLGLIINTAKTKVMLSAMTKEVASMTVNGHILEQVSSFVYLGAVFTDDSDCSKDIRKRLAMERTAMQSLSKIWKSKHMSRPTKIRLLKAPVWSVATYGCERWTIHKVEERQIEAFVLKCGATEEY